MGSRVDIAAGDYFSGDNLDILFTVSDGDNPGNPKDLTGASIDWVLAKQQGKAPLITKSIGSGVTITDAANGKGTVSIQQADTENLKGDTYWHELQVTVGGKRSTSMYGDFIIESDSAP